MKQEWKRLGLVLIPIVALLGAGCGGIRASHSISPASFFLPGLGHVSPSQTPSDLSSIPQDSVQPTVAQAN